MIKSLSYEQLNEVESHFINAKAEQEQVQMITRDIAEETNCSIDASGVHASGVTDVVSIKAQKIEKATRILKAWGEVVKATTAHFSSDSLMKDVFDRLYVQKIGAEQIMRELYISKTSLYEYRKEILRYGAMKAIEKGLMEV